MLWGLDESLSSLLSGSGLSIEGVLGIDEREISSEEEADEGRDDGCAGGKRVSDASCSSEAPSCYKKRQKDDADNSPTTVAPMTKFFMTTS